MMGRFGVKDRYLEGQAAVDFAKRTEMAVVNTYFQKRVTQSDLQDRRQVHTDRLYSMQKKSFQGD